MIRVLLVDDQELVRAGFRVILCAQPDIEVIGEAATGQQAISRAREFAPDVICMDVQMPGMDGLEATRQLIGSNDSCAGILMLTTFDRDDYLFDALQAGASGFLLKNTSPEKLVEAVRVIAQGDALLAPDVTRRVLDRLASTPVASADPAELDELTDREREVLSLLALGDSNAEIARRLYLGEATVKSHVSKILLKLGVRDRIHAVVWAYEHGIAVPGAAADRD